MTLGQFIRNFHAQEYGQDLVEYAVILAAVLAAVVVGSDSLANVITSGFNGLMGKVLKLTS